MSRLMPLLLVLGVSLILLSGCFGGSPATPVSNNSSSNVSSVPLQNQTPPPNGTVPAPNGTIPVPPTPPASDNGSVVPPTPPASDNGTSLPPVHDNSSVTPPVIIITPSVSGDAVIDSSNGTFTTHSCYGIEAKPAIIPAGTESVLRFRGYAANSEVITYTCGSEVRSNGNGGLLDFTRICSYPNAGHYTVWLALDGFVCASTPLEVGPAGAVSAEPSCTIAANSQNEERNGTTTTYSAKVMLYNQQRGASVDWDCGQTHFSRSLASVFNSAGSSSSAGSAGSLVTGALLVTCRFDTWPPPSPGSISIGGAVCGPMVVSP